MNKLEKILELSKSKGFEYFRGECNHRRIHDECKQCSFVEVMGSPKNCDFAVKAEELLEEYIEPKKLTKRERAFCEYAQSGYIVRDGYGYCIWHEGKPCKIDGSWHSPFRQTVIISTLFMFVSYDDEEPYSVEEMLKWEVEN